MRSFHWFHLYFIPKVRKYLDSKGLPSKILFILDNALSHTEPCEFNTVFYLPPNTTSLIQLLDQGVMRTFKAHYSQYSVEGLSILWNKTLIGRTTWKSGRIIPSKFRRGVTKKSEQIGSQRQWIPAGENYVQTLCMTSQDCYRVDQGNYEEPVNVAKKRWRGSEEFQWYGLEKFKSQ